MSNQNKLLYYVLCFKGYQSVGSRDAMLFEHVLEGQKIPHLIERVPKQLVDFYGLKGKESETPDSGYCSLGLVFTPDHAKNISAMLKIENKKKGEDFIFCEVKSNQKELETMVKNWDSILKK